MRKVKLRLTLLVPVILFALLFAGFASFMAQLAIAGVPQGSYAQMVQAFLQNTSMPIINNRAVLGIVVRGYPDANAIYRSRRESLLERVAASRPDRRVVALVLLDSLYTPEKMAEIIDPAQLNVIGVGAFLPYNGALGWPDEPWHGLSMSMGLMRTMVPRRIIPSDVSAYRLLDEWQAVRSKWEEKISMDQSLIRHSREILEILKAGEIMTDYGIGITINGEQIDIFTDPRILAMSPSERAQSKYYRQAIANQKRSLEYEEADANWKREHLQKDAGIYAVTVEGAAAKINALRGRPEIDLVDPMLFSGIMGMITCGAYNPLLRVEFVPPRPEPYDYPL